MQFFFFGSQSVRVDFEKPEDEPAALIGVQVEVFMADTDEVEEFLYQREVFLDVFETGSFGEPVVPVRLAITILLHGSFAFVCVMAGWLDRLDVWLTKSGLFFFFWQPKIFVKMARINTKYVALVCMGFDPTETTVVFIRRGE